MRINHLSEVFRHLSNFLLTGFCPDDCDMNARLIEYLPIITCSDQLKPAVSKEISNKGYCTTKRMYYYCLRLHDLAYYKPDHIPFPGNIMITPSSENDLNVHIDYRSNILNRTFYSDNSCKDIEFVNNPGKNLNPH
jgi:hypothetical protein